MFIHPMLVKASIYFQTLNGGWRNLLVIDSHHFFSLRRDNFRVAYLQ